MTSPGIAAPPETPTRSDDRSRPLVSMLSSPKYIVGTPLKIVQRCFSIGVDDRLELEARDEHHRAAVAGRHVEDARQPKTWNSGSTATPMSSSRNSNSCPATCSSCRG
jgi:hypothetical protein